MQEAGIDESDIAKLSGTTLFRIESGTLLAYDVSGSDAELVGEIDLSPSTGIGPIDPFEGSATGAELLISGDRALVIASGFARGSERTELIEVDIADPAAMSAMRSLEIEGAQVSARLQGSIARFVIESQPRYPGDPADSVPPPQPIPEEDAEPPTGATGETGPRA